MTDRELLEAAAKAAGIRLYVWGAKGWENFANVNDESNHKIWNPLKDDADAFRLAVQLGFMIDHLLADGGRADVLIEPQPKVEKCIYSEPHDSDRCAATRRAIVRAAAAIGRTL